MAKNKRTTAQRRAAAKASWALRRLKSADKPTPVNRTADKLPAVGIIPDLGAEMGMQPIRQVAIAYAPSTASVTKEGDDFFVTISCEGSLYRHRMSARTLRALGLDAIRTAG